MTLFLFVGLLFKLVNNSKWNGYSAKFAEVDISWTVKKFCCFVSLVSIFHSSVECVEVPEPEKYVCIRWILIGSRWISHKTKCVVSGIDEPIASLHVSENFAHKTWLHSIFRPQTDTFAHSHSANLFECWTSSDSLDNVVHVVLKRKTFGQCQFKLFATKF